MNRHGRSATALIVAIAVSFAIAASLAAGARPAAAGGSYLQGIDVSSWQGKPRWADVKNAGIRFVIVRATFSNAGLDAQYVRNRTLLRKLGIPFTAYHHAKPDASVGDAVAEADHFVDVAGLNGNNLLPALDLKTHGELSAEMLQDWVKAWLARVEERLGVKPMIYAPIWLWVDWTRPGSPTTGIGSGFATGMWHRQPFQRVTGAASAGRCGSTEKLPSPVSVARST